MTGKQKILLVLTALFLANSTDAQGSEVCSKLEAAYKHTLQPRILKGIPFELMFLSTRGSDVKCRAVFHISYDLWDELVTIRQSKGAPLTVELAGVPQTFCSILTCAYSKSLAGSRARLLLNPLWDGRLARLRAVTEPANEKSTLVNVNWKKIAEDLPSESIIFDFEMHE